MKKENIILGIMVLAVLMITACNTTTEICGDGSCSLHEDEWGNCPRDCPPPQPTVIALENYPWPFVHDGVFDGKIVVGAQGSTTDTVAAIDIAASLQNAAEGNPINLGLAILDTDAHALVGKENLIVIGSPCVNTVSAYIMGNPVDCLDGLTPGKARIILYDLNGFAQLVIAGYGDTETLGAAYVLADYEDYGLSGREVEVVVADLNTITVNKIN